MSEWILKSKNIIFNIVKAFSACDSVTWPEIFSPKAGDTVYLYVDAPTEAILYRCIVERTGLNKMDLSSIECVLLPAFYEGAGTFIRLKRIESYAEELLSRKFLNCHNIDIRGSVTSLTADENSIIRNRISGTEDIPKPENKPEPAPLAPAPVSAPAPDPPVRKKKRPRRHASPYAVTFLLVSAIMTVICAYFFLHIYSEADCYSPARCYICGRTEGEALGHDWKEADCYEPRTCKRCGATSGEALGHDWKEADCYEPETCRRCGRTEGEALGHDWIPASYDKPETCRRCGETQGNVKGYVSQDELNWTWHTKDMKNYTNLHVLEFTTPLRNVRWIKISFMLTEAKNLKGCDYVLYYKSGGKWKKGSKIAHPDMDKEITKTFEMDEETINEFTFLPVSNKDGEFNYKFYVLEAQVSVSD